MLNPGDIKVGQKKHLTTFNETSTSIALKKIIDQFNQNQHLIITDEIRSANQIYNDLSFLLGQTKNIYLFPDLEILPYDTFSPSQAILSNRLKTLYNIQSDANAIMIIAINTLIKRLPPTDYIDTNTFILAKNQTFHLEKEKARLYNSGYQHVNQVIKRGEYSIRGGIVDIFPMGSEWPLRIDLFDDEIDTLRTFDPKNQRSQQYYDKIEILPAHEFLLNEQSLIKFKHYWKAYFGERGTTNSLYQDTLNCQYASGIEHYLPLFYEQTSSFLDYVSNNTIISHIDETTDQAQKYWQNIQSRYHQLNYDIYHPILASEQVFIPFQELFKQLRNHPQVHIHSKDNNKTKAKPLPFNQLPSIDIDYKAKKPMAKLESFLKKNQASKYIFTAISPGRKELLIETLNKVNINPYHASSWEDALKTNAQFIIVIAPFVNGCHYKQNYIVITETDLFRHASSAISQNSDTSNDMTETSHESFQDIAQLKPNDPVVHLEYGVGIYEGLTKLNATEQANEFLTLKYANNEKLYVPIHMLNLIKPYNGSGQNHVPINKLGTDKWQKTKEKAAKKIHDVAAELLEVYARRESKRGFKNDFNQKDYLAFTQNFPFEETQDQKQAIQDVLQDMIAEKPMDRLVCGDVGFGKTEVAMRAAFLAIYNMKQVAVLVPTTLLAQQHYDNFQDRFAEMPAKVELLSRFKTPKQQKHIIQELTNGDIDIVIGTHKLLSQDINFYHLGLLIIDEEHRFGVKHKEAIKKLKANVDILTMTATPIPRTLHMALSEIRDLSIIQTPPPKRLSIKTFVKENKNELIREAVLRETMRGGQVYFIHNEVETIFNRHDQLQSLFPEMRIAIAHGQMREKELENIMFDFQQKKYHILLCTTIIESGIDIANANTMIIERADCFGLAQLHQLRGRVGRAHHQAFAYLLTPPFVSLNKDAKKRLKAIEDTDSLGAGFMLANHDLEIRGAGEILGQEQSGNISGIGFSLYMELLQKTVQTLNSGEKIESNNIEHMFEHSEVELRIPALIPETYITDTHTRLLFYNKLAKTTQHDELQKIKVELIDRFGPMPEPLNNLLTVSQLRLDAETIGIQRLEMNQSGGNITFKNHPHIEPDVIIKLVKSKPQYFQLAKNGKIIISCPLKESVDRIQFAKDIIQMLRPSESSD